MIKTGHIYKTADGRKVAVFNFNTVQLLFECVVIDKGEFYTVLTDGRQYETRQSHNDLVEEVK